MPAVEIEPTHANWIFGSEVGQHIHPTVRSDSRVNSESLGEREIPQHILRARGVPEQTKRPSVRADRVTDVREQSVYDAEIPLLSRKHGVSRWRETHSTEVVGIEVGELVRVEFRDQNYLRV